ncbi:putative AMP-activated kinase, glycogen-binding protein [Helianthus annuus]|nr:putative AMP-activated kinase, glycogen-binding protein [Helianthus annuus]
MLHTQFVWSHGGNQVFLCGDFTGWVKYQQILPVEGSAMTFVTICDLPPRYHKLYMINESTEYVAQQRDLQVVIILLW